MAGLFQERLNRKKNSIFCVIVVKIRFVIKGSVESNTTSREEKRKKR
jgi:hypothetical protein